LEWINNRGGRRTKKEWELERFKRPQALCIPTKLYREKIDHAGAWVGWF
jgi:hypothetical protein